ncbi:MAG: hypothetical protein ACLGJB_13200, partial [Blastocatellia bacterium]
MPDRSKLSQSVVTESEPASQAGARADAPIPGMRDLHAFTFGKPFAPAFLTILAVYVAVRLWDLTSYGLFSDEIFSLWLAGSSWREMMALAIEDVVHPPLFYILLKAWVLAGGGSLLWVKLFPVAASVGAVIPFFLLCRELKVKAGAADLAFALMAVNEYLITYSQDLRMYSLLMLLALSSAWLFARLLNSAAPTPAAHAALLAANL